jgi:hypothetical protein
MNQFIFRKHDNVGAAAAENDTQFLSDCFVDTGDISYLLDRNNPKRIIVGRTGAGKSALLYHLRQSSNHIIQLSPHDLSLNFIATNKVLAFFEEAGVNLSPFYVLLWKHLLVVELIKNKYQIRDESTYKNFMRSISTIVRKKDRNKELALDYFEKWGDKFWLTTEERIHELTSRVEESLTTGINGKLAGISLNAEGAQKLSLEQRKEIKEHGLDAVSRVQIRELENMLTVLEENIFDDSKNPYYVEIDMLDEDWADDRIKFKLIRSLIDVVNRFKRLSNVKIILAIRHDLLYKVHHLESVAGFQEEKFKALYLNLKWEKTELEKLVGEDTFDYMLARTFNRPRDIIMFVNECLELCSGKPKITASIIKEAENTYSHERMQSLSYEWKAILPDLEHTSRLLFGMREHFEVNQITQDSLGSKFEEIVYSLNDGSLDPITKLLYGLYTTKHANFESVRNFMLREFHSIGLLGIKTGPTDAVNWIHANNSRLGAGQVRPNSVVFIHPMFYRALGIKLKGQSS